MGGARLCMFYMGGARLYGWGMNDIGEAQSMYIGWDPFLFDIWYFRGTH